jgi:hypothetical protein
MSDRQSRRDDTEFFPCVELRRARLCLDCEMIFDGPQCPACASESFVPVTRWIRPTELPPPSKPAAAQPPSPPPPASRPRQIMKKSLYVGLGAYGMWKMLFEPSKPRRTKKQKAEPPDAETTSG